MAARIAPALACVFMTSNSAAVSLPGLLRMCSGMASFPQVVQKGSGFNRLNQIVVVNAHMTREIDGMLLYASDGAVSNLIFSVNRHCQKSQWLTCTSD